jgi:hypothetical protein
MSGWWCCVGWEEGCWCRETNGCVLVRLLVGRSVEVFRSSRVGWGAGVRREGPVFVVAALLVPFFVHIYTTTSPTHLPSILFE